MADTFPARSVRDDYYILMWNFYDPLFFSGAAKAALAIQRFREMGCNGGTLVATFVDPGAYLQSLEAFSLPKPTFKMAPMGASPFLENRFPFYVMNICRPLYREWGEAKPAFRHEYETFEKEGNRSVFVRRPCVNDPAVRDAMDHYTRRVLEGLKDARDLSLLYDLRDEPSIGSFLLATDTCFCEHCLRGMREWLKTRYGCLDTLNLEWGTGFDSWERVEPMPTSSALARRREGNWNFAPWHDHRQFMNETFAQICRQQAEVIRRQDPEAVVGLAGTQCPWVFGGYDFSTLVPELDWAEPYAYGNSLDCYRSFKRRRAVPLLRTSGLGGSVKDRESVLWSTLFQAGGHGGTIIWQSNAMLDVGKDGLPLRKDAKELGRVFTELRGGIPRLLQRAREDSSPIAVHYSQASINADFITSVAGRWRSIAASEPQRFPAYQCREAWWKMLEDMGFRPLFISSRNIEAGDLIRRGFRVLVLPRSIALSDDEARQIRVFVEQGGTLVADGFVGRMDEHCRERETGVLDAFLGIQRTDRDGYHSSRQMASLDWNATPVKRPKWGSGALRTECTLIEEQIVPLPGARVLGCTEYTDTPIGIEMEHGQGSTVLMNAAPTEYMAARRVGSGGADYLDFFGSAFVRAGIKPEAELTPPEDGARVCGWSVFGFTHGRARYFGLAPDLAMSQDGLGAIRSDGRRQAGVRVRIQFPVSGFIHEIRSGRYLGRGKAAVVELQMGETPVFAVLPYRVRRLKLWLNRGWVHAEVRRAESGRMGEHMMRFECLDSRGRVIPDAGANVVAPGGRCKWAFAPSGKAVRVLCVDVASGVRREIRLPQRAQ